MEHLKGARVRALAVALMVWALLGCDPQHRKRCEWYLVPDVDRADKAAEGMIPVCARNFVTNKQDCRLQTELSFAEKAYNRKFRYVDLHVKNVGIPRTVDSIEYCE